MSTIADRSERPPLIRLGRVEARKMIDTRAALWLLILTGLSAVAVVAVGILFEDADRDFGETFVDAMLAVSVLLPIVPILLVTGEWSQRTALGTFALVPIRERVMAAKALALLGLLVVVAGLCLGLAALGTAATGDGFGFSGADAGQVVLYELLTLLFGFGLAAVLMNSPAAIVFNFVVPVIVGAIAAISAGVESAVSWVDPSAWSSLADTTSPDWDKVATATIAWIVVPLVLGTIRLRRRDVS